jgi:hypothetical protein
VLYGEDATSCRSAQIAVVSRESEMVAAASCGSKMVTASRGSSLSLSGGRAGCDLPAHSSPSPAATPSSLWQLQGVD